MSRRVSLLSFPVKQDLCLFFQQSHHPCPRLTTSLSLRGGLTRLLWLQVASHLASSRPLPWIHATIGLLNAVTGSSGGLGIFYILPGNPRCCVLCGSLDFHILYVDVKVSSSVHSFEPFFCPCPSTSLEDEEDTRGAGRRAVASCCALVCLDGFYPGCRELFVPFGSTSLDC